MIKVTIWNENIQEKTNAVMQQMYLKGIHGVIANAVTWAVPTNRVDKIDARHTQPLEG